MTDFEAYQEYIQRKHNAFCKAVIRYAARDKILQLRRKWERQVSLDYLMDEKFVQFAGPEPDEEYPFTVCGQTVLLCKSSRKEPINFNCKPERCRMVSISSMTGPNLLAYISIPPFGKESGRCLTHTASFLLHPLRDTRGQSFCRYALTFRK